MPRTKLQDKQDGTNKKPPKNLEVLKQQSGGWKVHLKKGGTIPSKLQGLYLTDADAWKDVNTFYSTRK